MKTSIYHAALERLEKPLHHSWVWDAAANVWRKRCTAKHHGDECILPLARFFKNRKRRDKLNNWCRNCVKSYLAERAIKKGFVNVYDYVNKRAFARGFKNLSEYVNGRALARSIEAMEVDDGSELEWS